MRCACCHRLPPSRLLPSRTVARLGKASGCSHAGGTLPRSRLALRSRLVSAGSCASAGGSVPSSPSPLRLRAVTCPCVLHVTPAHATWLPPSPQGGVPSCHAAPALAANASAQFAMARGSDSSAAAAGQEDVEAHVRQQSGAAWVWHDAAAGKGLQWVVQPHRLCCWRAAGESQLQPGCASDRGGAGRSGGADGAGGSRRPGCRRPGRPARQRRQFCLSCMAFPARRVAGWPRSAPPATSGLRCYAAASPLHHLTVIRRSSVRHGREEQESQQPGPPHGRHV